MHDLAIRNAVVVDGLGNPAFEGELAISDGRIAEVGQTVADARENIDADGLTLAPGIIDLHTHFDAQLTWDPYATPSNRLGVTTVVIGNCGFTIAPCKPGDRERILKNLTHVEGMSLEAMQEGIDWDFETFPDYMNSLGGVPTQQTVVILNEKFGMDHDPKAVAKFKREAWETMDLEPVLIPSTMAVFEHYRPTLSIGIGTGAERPHAEHLLAKHGLLARIDSLVTASDVTHGKPHPETFLTVAEQMGVAPQHCVVFEDTEIGYQAARDAGMDCIMVKQGEIQR